jgi:hypothetical protein
MEKYIWSLDISTTNVGSALWDYKGNLIELKLLSLNIDKEIAVEFRDLHKADLFSNYCEKYKSRVEKELMGKIEHVFVEAPLQNTPKNINTTALLLGFNGIARYVLYRIFGFEPEKITVHEARKLFCPELVKTSKSRKGEIKETLSFPPEYRKEKKLYVWKKVAKLEPQIEWFYTRNGTLKDICYDMSDSYAVGYAGLKKMGVIK